MSVKYDNGKPPLDLVSRRLVEGAARALGYGAAKYERHNYLKGGLEVSRLVASLLRHTFAWQWGEDVDEESGLSHLDHMAACVQMLHDTVALFPEKDDRMSKDDRYK